MKKLLIIILILIPSNLFAADWFTWDKENTYLHVPLTALYVADLGQTLWAHDNYWEKGTPKHEQNKVLGKYPSRGEIYTYFAASYALNTAIVYMLPEKWSHAFQGGIITVELYAIDNNLGWGLGVKF
jgi:hypothetical protein